MDFSLQAVDRKVREYADKIGSDYFPLPVFMNRFEKATYDFVGERAKIAENTQEVVDDIKRLVRIAELVIIDDPNESLAGRYLAAQPADYLRLLRCTILFPGDTQSRRVTITKHGEIDSNLVNPYKKPSRNYPLVIQLESSFKVYTSSTPAPTFLKLSYVKTPSIVQPVSGTYGPTELATRIVDLPDDAILKIMQSVVTDYYINTGDPRGNGAYQLQESFRKVFR